MESNVIIALTFLGIFSVSGTVGNISVIWFYVKHLKTALDVFIAALACVDLITCVCVIPFTMVMEALDYEINQLEVCKFYYFLITSNVPFSVLLMVIIACDRYLLINRPHIHILNVRRAIVIVFSLILFVFVLGIFTTLTVGTVLEMGNTTEIHEHISQKVYAYLDISENATETEILAGNATIQFPHSHSIPVKIYFCGAQNPEFLGPYFISSWKVVYASIYGVALFIVIVLYSLVYKEIIKWRKKRTRLLSISHQPTCSLLPVKETETTGTGKSPSPRRSSNSCHFRSVSKRRLSRVLGAAWRNRQFYQNSKTAFMLFSVTAIFTIVFTPAFLMMNNVITLKKPIYYMYFIYNVANPVVYATLNKDFRLSVKNQVCG